MLGKDKQNRSDRIKSKLWLLRSRFSAEEISNLLKGKDIDICKETIRRWNRQSYKSDIPVATSIKLEPIVDELIKDLKIDGSVR